MLQQLSLLTISFKIGGAAYEFSFIVSDLFVGNASIETRGTHSADDLSESLLFFNLINLLIASVKSPNFSIEIFHPFDPKYLFLLLSTEANCK